MDNNDNQFQKIFLPSDESRIIDATKDNTLTKGNFSGGKYFSIQFSDEIGEWQISPKIKLTFSFIPDKNDISYVKIQKLKKVSNEWIEQECLKLSSFGFKHIGTLLNFISNDLDLKSVTNKKLTIAENTIDIDTETIKKIKTVLSDNKSLQFFKKTIQDLMNNSELVTSEDVVAVGYRKNELKTFKNLLNETGFIDKYKSDNKIIKPGYESVWQFFFEKNPWIWGYGLSYVWSGPFDENPVEKIVTGHTFFQSGKRADGVLSTISTIKSFVIVEIKLPDHELLEQASKAYRKECWKISGEVSGGISQCQKTKHKFISQVKDKLNLTNNDGNPTGETIYAIKPKSFLIVGNLDQFKTEHGINEEKYSSFELFRNSNIDPEIITYDELYQRANHIVNNQISKSVE